MTPRPPRRTDGGFTLIESLVVVAILGLLAILTLAAVQRARESARRLECARRLGQLGVALSGFVADQGAFPSAMPVSRTRPGRFPSASYHEFSGLFDPLPYLEQGPLCHATNLHARFGSWDAANRTAVATRLDAFLCPSDARAGRAARERGPTNFRFNVSTENPLRTLDLARRAGPFVPLRRVAPAAIADGLSATIGMGERSLGGGSAPRFDRCRDAWFTGDLGGLAPQDPDGVAAVCAALGGRSPAFSMDDAGRSWAGNSFIDTWYNHVTPPNAPAADCALEDKGNAVVYTGEMAMAARGSHPPGVHALYLDGSVRVQAPGIALPVWRALATRAGGEAVGGE